jgi:hypothetical protein
MTHESPHPSNASGAIRRLRSKVKETIGEVLGDEPLRDEAVLEHQAVEARSRADDRQARAGRRAHVAEVRIRDAELAADRMEMDAGRRSEEDRSAVERRRRRQDDDTDRELARRAEEAKRRQAALHEAVARTEVEATRTWSNDQRAAARTDHAASRARRQADLLTPGSRPDDPAAPPRSR